jgi:receptor protein-tyrosine kinase
VYPNVPVNLGVALALGLLIGVSVAVSRETFDTTVQSVEDVEDVLAAPVMASVAYDSSLAKSPDPALVGAPSVRSEDFRLLRTNLQFADLDGDPRVFVVTSSLSGEGKTSTAIGLAAAVSQAGRKVLLIDGDLRHPSLADVLGLESNVGLTTVLLGRQSVAESIQRHAPSGIDVLTSGAIPPNPTEILQSKAARMFLSEARDMFDIVIIDSPPLLPVADAAILAVEADGALLVTRHGKTHRQNLVMARARLEAVGARLFGAVLNMAPRGGLKGYGANAYGYQPKNAQAAETP